MNRTLSRIANLFITRRRRRFLVALVLTAPGIGLLLGVPRSGETLDVAHLVSLILLVAAGLGLILLLHITSHSATNPRSLLDERGMTVRGHAYEVAYWAVGGGLTLALSYVMFAMGNGLWLPSSRSDWLIIAGMVGYILLTLPASAVAWSEADVIFDDGEHPEAAQEVMMYPGRDLGPAHRGILIVALIGSLLLVGAQASGLSEHPAELNYVLAGVVTGCVLQLLMVRSRRSRR